MNNLITNTDTSGAYYFNTTPYKLNVHSFSSEEGLYDFVWYEKETGKILYEGKRVVETIESLKQHALIAFIADFSDRGKDIDKYKLEYRKWN